MRESSGEPSVTNICDSDSPERVMIIIIGLVILVAAVVVGVAGVLSNNGSGHALTHPFALFGYHVTGSTGTLFLYGIVAGAIGALSYHRRWPDPYPSVFGHHVVFHVYVCAAAACQYAAIARFFS